MGDVVVRPPGLGDAEELAAAARQVDRDEAAALGSTDLLSLIKMSTRNSVRAYTVTIDGRMACMFGVAPLSLLSMEIGLPWMVGTDVLTRNGGALMRRTGPYITSMLELFPRLANHVHVENRPAVRWLRRCGFQMHPPVRVPSGALFHPFTMEASDV